jgi:kinesin family protein 1
LVWLFNVPYIINSYFLLHHRIHRRQLEIVDLKGNKIGVMNLEVAPCDSKGREYTEKDDMFVDSPDDLVSKELNFCFKITNCRGLPNKYTVRS